MKNNLHINTSFDFNLIKLVGIVIVIFAIYLSNYILGIIGLFLLLIRITAERTEKPVGDNSVEVKIGDLS